MRTLGLDLGTNSIGWAIRDTEASDGNQIVDYGVTVFRKGVGDGKQGEFSLAAERRKNRSKRRLYNAKRYRKWGLLKVLIENHMCPLKPEELRLWSVGRWEDGRNKGREYPMGNDEWKKWLAMDPAYFGDRGQSENGKQIRKSPYDLRCELLEKVDEADSLRLNRIGRALYHLVQRRGFKTSRKSGKSSYGESELLKKFFEKYPDKANWKSSQVFNFLRSDSCTDGELRLIRIRKETGVLQRKLYEEEFSAICQRQQLSEELTDRLHNAIYFVRPLRTQKGLVGKCTLEKGKARIPLSHPAFEEFRALQFINNVQWREARNNGSFSPIPMDLKKEILETLFFRKIERGKNKGKVDSRAYFKFDEIIDTFSENGKWEFNYKNKPNVPTCPMIAGLMNVFDDKWTVKFITEKNSFGIYWQGLVLKYETKYGTRKKKRVGARKRAFTAKKIGEHRELDYEGIWHLLFDFLQTRDKGDELEEFCKGVLGWDDEKANEFANIDMQQGYGSLSRSAIVKILPHLRDGYIYPKAVTFANLSKVLGKEFFLANREKIEGSITETIGKVDREKEELDIVNSLVQDYFASDENVRGDGRKGERTEVAKTEVENKLKTYFEQIQWSAKSESARKEYFDAILGRYLSFLDGSQQPNEKASTTPSREPDRDYFKLPRLDEAIKSILREKFSADERLLKHLYHPSDVQFYLPSKEGKLGNPQPPTKAWKNPMAMRTMYELRKLINYLIESGIIDEETKVVIEMARELNDANRRWAIQTWQRHREAENIEFAKAILGVAKPKYPGLNENDANNVDKVRLWWEQLPDSEEVYKQVKELKNDVDKYRLWKEQECQCIYTGKLINLADLFDGTKTQFAHTFQRSASFDSSLANLTVSDAYYNVHIQKNRIPTQLENYDKEWRDPTSGHTYSAIRPRIQKWIEKTISLRQRIESNKGEAKKAVLKGEVERKNDLTKFRRLLELDLEYWDKKVKTFTLEEIPNSWKNSQLTDTQIITKYARSYMKSFFRRVDVQKGAVTSQFRKIYGLAGDEQKDRSRHTHHAMDAAVLTLVPSSARRDAILKRYYEAVEKGLKFHTTPYESFDISHVSSIDKNVLVNHVSRDRAFVPTYRKARKRGKLQFVNNADGQRIPIIVQGDSVRGQLHKETFLGAIKVPRRNKSGYAIRQNGEYLLQKNEKTREDEIWLVVRKPIKDAEPDKIVDPILKEEIKRQMAEGVPKEEAVDFQGNRIRHVRCKVALPSFDKSLKIKQHSHLSSKVHKQYYRTDNSANYLCIYYEGVNDRDRTVHAFRFVSLFEYARLKEKNIRANPEYASYMKVTRGRETALTIKHIFKVGDQVVLYKGSIRAIGADNFPVQHLFRVYKFNNSGADYIFLQNVVEARPDSELGGGETEFNPDKYQPRLKLTAENFKALVKGVDFDIEPDGQVMRL